MRYVATLMACVVATACASWDKSETVITEIGRLPADETIGLTRSEVEARLGLVPAAQAEVFSAALDGGVLVERVTQSDMVSQQRCPGGKMPELTFARAGKTWSMPSLIFRDGVLSGFGDEPRRGDDPTQAAYLTATCKTFHSSGKDTTRDVFAVALAAPLLLPFGALFGGMNAVGLIGAPDINASLAQLPLGAEPPGGLEAWPASLPDGAKFISRDGDVVRVGFHHQEADGPSRRAAAVVTFEDGVVVELVGGRCVLTTARAFRCERG